jgi:hypothetical protein
MIGLSVELVVLRIKSLVGVDVEIEFALGNVSGDVLDGTLFLDVFQHPFVDVVVESVGGVETHHFLRGMLVAIYLLGVQIDAEVDEETLVLLVDRLVTFRIGSLNRFQYFRALHYPVVDI